MYKQKISISVGNSYKIDRGEVVKIIKKVGFDAVSPAYDDSGAHIKVIETALEQGLSLCSLHAPFKKAADMWSEEAQLSEPVLESLMKTADDCEKYNIPVMVVHTWIGFDYRVNITKSGLENFEKLVDYAKTKGVKIAFENTEGIEYLYALEEHFKEEKSVGFCWDSGHELCYNMEENLLEKLGARLMVTHLNDNLGCSRFDGTTYWTDDLHLLPYDGIADWEQNIARLKSSEKLEYLNFELNITSKPNRQENDLYSNMDISLYFTEAYKRACKIAYRYSK